MRPIYLTDGLSLSSPAPPEMVPRPGSLEGIMPMGGNLLLHMDQGGEMALYTIVTPPSGNDGSCGECLAACAIDNEILKAQI